MTDKQKDKAPAKDKAKDKAPPKAKHASADDVNEALAAGAAPADLDADAAYYCPGCGRRADTDEVECVGGELGHAPIAVVSTAELAGDKHTAAPDTD